MQLYALHIKSSNARASADWYVKTFGAKVDDPIRKVDGSLLIRLKLFDVPVAITEHANADQLPRAPLGIHIGLEHFGILVDDLDTYVKKFEALGIEILDTVHSEGGVKWTFVRAPDGVRLEVVQTPSSSYPRQGLDKAK